MTSPFNDQGEAAVCARVAIAWVKRTRHQTLPDEPNPQILIGIAVARLDGLHFGSVRLALLSLSVWTGQKRPSKDWLTGVLLRDYYGFSIRRCYYAEYKANRRTSPPC